MLYESQSIISGYLFFNAFAILNVRYREETVLGLGISSIQHSLIVPNVVVVICWQLIVLYGIHVTGVGV